MLGNKNGVAMKLRQSSPCLVSFHCSAHRLQLAILDIADKVHGPLHLANLRTNS